ncbi:hypothetical protein D3C79_751140 [compost metagenome]
MNDHVDFVVAQWAQAMPSVDVTSMEIFGRMARIQKHLERMRAEALAQYGFKGRGAVPSDANRALPLAADHIRGDDQPAGPAGKRRHGRTYCRRSRQAQLPGCTDRGR